MESQGFRSGLLSSITTDLEDIPYNETSYSKYFSVIDDYRLFNEQKGINEVISLINIKVQKSSTRYEGLIILDHLIKYCDSSVYEEYCIQWTAILLRCIESYDDKNVWVLASQVSTNILEESLNFPELKRELSNIYVPQLIETLLKTNNEYGNKKIFIIESFTKCMQYYPRVCLKYMSKIESFILSELSNNRHVQLGSKCFAKLAFCGGTGNTGKRHSELWSTMFNQLLGSLNETIYALYKIHDLSNGIDFSSENTQRLSLEPIKQGTDTNTDGTIYTLEQRFNTLCSVMIAMLRQNSESSVNMPVSDVFKFIGIVLSINPHLLSEVTFKNLAMASVLPNLHIRCMDILKSLIECCMDLILPYTKVINSLFVQTLIWSKCTIGPQKLFSKVRISVYKTFNTWLNCVASSVCIESIQTEMISNILHDIKPVENTAKLDESVKNLEPANKKKRKNTSGIGTISSYRVSGKLAKHQTELAVAALELMKDLIMYCGGLISFTHHKILQEVVINLVIKVQGAHNDSKQSILPYTETEALCALYKLLVALATHPAPVKSTDCLAIVLRLLNNELNGDKYVEVMKLCRESSAFLINIVHARAPSMAASFTTTVQTQAERGNVKITIPTMDQNSPAKKRNYGDLPSNMVYVVSESSSEDSCNNNGYRHPLPSKEDIDNISKDGRESTAMEEEGSASERSSSSSSDDDGEIKISDIIPINTSMIDINNHSLDSSDFGSRDLEIQNDEDDEDDEEVEMKDVQVPVGGNNGRDIEDLEDICVVSDDSEDMDNPNNEICPKETPKGEVNGFMNAFDSKSGPD